MKNKLLALIFLGMFLINFISAVPKIEPYVNDFANILTDNEEMGLNLYIDLIEQNTGWEIAIVTTINTEGQDKLEYANKIGDENGVGKLNKDNGIVILYSLKNGGAIATGRYSESIFNDAKVGRIGRENKNYFDKEKYYEGFFSIVKDVEKEINTKNNEKFFKSKNESNSTQWIFWIIFFISAFVFGSQLLEFLFCERQRKNSTKLKGGKK